MNQYLAASVVIISADMNQPLLRIMQKHLSTYVEFSDLFESFLHCFFKMLIFGMLSLCCC